MNDGTTVDITEDEALGVEAPPSPRAQADARERMEPPPWERPQGATLDLLLYDLLEQRLPDEAGEFLARRLGRTMPRNAEGNRYDIISAGRFHGENTLDLLAHLQKKQLSGALVMVERDDERVLYLKNGTLIGAASSVLFESLGRLLYQADIVNHEDSGTLVDAEEKQGAHSLLLWISTEHLHWAVERRVWEVAAAVHLIKKGHFVFIAGEPELDCPLLELDATEVAKEGVRRHETLKSGTAEEGYHPPSMGALPKKIERRLNPIDIGEDTLREILKRNREAEKA